ncbi:MAG TPA: hypothetical protein VNX18_05795 [Bryobacteraceae bacterium]|jgi:hypothetical protein|nr:hypothetical protein [Bryobacteraceae bacterium]
MTLRPRFAADMDATTLTRLLRGEHLDMPERVELGLWPHPPIPIEHVIQHLTNILQETHWFPHLPLPTQTGQSISEWPTIERESTNQFIYRAQRTDPSNPSVVVNSIERPFQTAREAAEFCLRWAFIFPATLMAGL